MKQSALRGRLAQLAAQHLQRRRRVVTAALEGAGVVVDGSCRSFSAATITSASRRNPALAAALARSAAAAGAGSGASHLVSGHTLEHERLEEELAQFTGRERALLFSTGYMANLAAITCLAARDARIVMDRLCHASLIDAARLSGARLRRFAHGEAALLQRLCRARRLPLPRCW